MQSTGSIMCFLPCPSGTCLSHSGVSINPFILPYSLIHYTAHQDILNMCSKHLFTNAFWLLIIYSASKPVILLSVSFRHVLKLLFIFRLEELQTLPTLTCIVQLHGLSPFNSSFPCQHISWLRDSAAPQHIVKYKTLHSSVLNSNSLVGYFCTNLSPLHHCFIHAPYIPILYICNVGTSLFPLKFKTNTVFICRETQ